MVHEEHLRSRAATIPKSDSLARWGRSCVRLTISRPSVAGYQRAAQQALEQVDVLVTPTAPIVAPRLGEATVEIEGKSLPMRPVLRRFTAPLNLAGLPACTVPCGFSPGPIGLQIIGKPFAEAMVLRVAHAYESSTDWHRRHPA